MICLLACALVGLFHVKSAAGEKVSWENLCFKVISAQPVVHAHQILALPLQRICAHSVPPLLWKDSGATGMRKLSNCSCGCCRSTFTVCLPALPFLSLPLPLHLTCSTCSSSSCWNQQAAEMPHFRVSRFLSLFFFSHLLKPGYLLLVDHQHSGKLL